MVFGRWWAAAPEISSQQARDLAFELVGRFGERSTAVAQYQALKAREAGDGMAMRAWRWIAGVTLDILRSEPGDLAGQEAGAGD